MADPHSFERSRRGCPGLGSHGCYQALLAGREAGLREARNKSRGGGIGPTPAPDCELAQCLQAWIGKAGFLAPSEQALDYPQQASRLSDAGQSIMTGERDYLPLDALKSGFLGSLLHRFDSRAQALTKTGAAPAEELCSVTNWLRSMGRPHWRRP